MAGERFVDAKTLELDFCLNDAQISAPKVSKKYYKWHCDYDIL